MASTFSPRLLSFYSTTQIALGMPILIPRLWKVVTESASQWSPGRRWLRESAKSAFGTTQSARSECPRPASLLSRATQSGPDHGGARLAHGAEEGVGSAAASLRGLLAPEPPLPDRLAPEPLPGPPLSPEPGTRRLLRRFRHVSTLLIGRRACIEAVHGHRWSARRCQSLTDVSALGLQPFHGSPPFRPLSRELGDAPFRAQSHVRSQVPRRSQKQARFIRLEVDRGTSESFEGFPDERTIPHGELRHERT